MNTLNTPGHQIFGPLGSFMDNMKELHSIRAIYSFAIDNPIADPSDPSSGNYDAEVLLKSAIVFIVTCWDAYIKQLLTSSFDFMIGNANNPDIFPVQVRMIAAENLLPPKPNADDPDKTQHSMLKERESWHQERWKKDIWSLAGSGWIELLRNNKDKVIEQYAGRFQIPRPDRIDSLFANVIGLRRLSFTWAWDNMSNEEAIHCLNILLNLRGDIVHQNRPHRKVCIGDIDYYTVFIEKMAGISANAVRRYIYDQIQIHPWADNNILSLESNYNPAHCS